MMKCFKVQRFLSLREVKEQFFPSRSERWILNLAKAGGFGDVVRDSGGWLIPELGILEYLGQHRITAGAAPASGVGRAENLVQFHGK